MTLPRAKIELKQIHGASFVVPISTRFEARCEPTDASETTDSSPKTMFYVRYRRGYYSIHSASGETEKLDFNQPLLFCGWVITLQPVALWQRASALIVSLLLTAAMTYGPGWIDRRLPTRQNAKPTDSLDEIAKPSFETKLLHGLGVPDE